jgi:SNF2 family DNA or RNA helicase
MARPYGSIILKDDAWHVDAEPHVMLRLRRVFGKVARKAVGTLRFPNTPENCRELLWFSERYPMQISGVEDLEAGARRHRETILRLEQIVGGTYEAPSFNMAVPPRQYQMQAASIYLEQGFLLLADDLGLGKTCSAICSFMDPRTLPAVVVCLAHLPAQWFAQIKKFAPDLVVHTITHGTPYPLPSMLGRGPDVLIVSYARLVGWAETLAKHCKSVVFDEAQELRRDESQRYGAAMHLTRSLPFRLALTATPVYNYGGEIYNVLNAVKPEALGDLEEFKNEWGGGGDGKVKDPKALGTYLREGFFMLRRTREEVARELPDIIRIPHTIQSDTDALDSVQPAARELARVILSQTQEFRGQKMQAAEELSNRLRQATGIAKAPYVADFVRLIVESGEKVVLFGWHRAVYQIWNAKLGDLHPAMYTGSESAAQKAAAIQRFVTGGTDVLILSLRSGAGIDGLQDVCRVAVFGELDWAAGVLDQCLGRLHRDGQTSPVTAYYLVAEDGADPIMAEIIGLKREQADGIRDPQRDVLERLETSGDHAKKLAQFYLAKHGATAKDLVEAFAEDQDVAS